MHQNQTSVLGIMSSYQGADPQVHVVQNHDKVVIHSRASPRRTLWGSKCCWSYASHAGYNHGTAMAKSKAVKSGGGQQVFEPKQTN